MSSKPAIITSSGTRRPTVLRIASIAPIASRSLAQKIASGGVPPSANKASAASWPPS